MYAHHCPSSLVPGSVQAAACITAGVSVNCQDDIGSTPLHVAAAYGRVELVDALVREGAEIDRPNNFGWTPIMQAARNGQSTVAIKLLNNGVNVNLKNKLGANLLALAVASNDEKTITAVINDMSHKIVDLSLDPLPLQAYFNSVQRHSYSPPLDNSQRQPLTPLTRLYPSTRHCNYYYHSSLIHFVTPPRQHVHSRYECTQEWLTKQEGMRFSQSSPSGLKNYKKNKGFKHWWKQVTSRYW
uniref:Uncharacterized protein n=1 Tax=Timema poppense TaxID=170557 RepID=A0A7R9GT73_TIMPO|nr:unnamed protein product [Timema poppensis]